MSEPFNLQEWIAKAREDPKVAAQPVIILLAILGLAWKFLYAPQKVVLLKELKGKKAVEDQIKGLQSAVTNMEDLKIEVAEMKSKWKKIEELCYKKNEAHLFLQDVRRIGRVVGLDIKNINPLPTVPKIFESVSYEEYPIKIAFSGSFPQLGIFLREMEKSPKLVFVNLPELVPDASGSLRFDLIPTTILLSDQLAQAPPGNAPPP